ncbi:hypothetical protein GCM10009789_67170 [Kribbella sancticallisti]|uniref:DksA C4-type domain-containing protein n=1 Tax=Kribbella sancticallisti TaxID=460087 RepID=A0ABN2EFK4_9ACTN
MSDLVPHINDAVEAGKNWFADLTAQALLFDDLAKHPHSILRVDAVRAELHEEVEAGGIIACDVCGDDPDEHVLDPGPHPEDALR